MRSLASAVTAAALMFVIGAPTALAETAAKDGAVVAVDARGTNPEYPVLTRGQVVVVNAQRLVVTQEPPPLGKVAEAPPAAPPTTASDRPSPPEVGAIWVDAHWTYGPKGLVWVDGSYVSPKAGHVFVPPRSAAVDGGFIYFTGFYVPQGVYLRSYFNRYYYSGAPTAQSGYNPGPYWPIGVSTPANSAQTRANDPYWPIGAPR